VFRFSLANGPAFQNSDFISASTFGSPALNTWYFLVAWYDSVADTLNIQINNGTVDGKSNATGCFDSAKGFTLGDFAFTPFDGLLDEVGIWKKVLSAPERTWLYNAGAGRSYTDIVNEANALNFAVKIQHA
jgi:hypothetical protein